MNIYLILIVITTMSSLALSIYAYITCSKEKLNNLAVELRVQKKQLETIIENMSDHCVVVDKTGKYIKVNQAAKDVFSSIDIKQVGDWLKGARYYDIQGNEINASSVPAVKVINGEKLSNYRLTLRNDEKEIHFDVNGTPVYDDNGEFLFGVICSHDVTKLVLHEKEIILQNEKLVTIINNISDMAILSISDKEGNFLHYSNAANNYFSENTFKTKVGATYQKGVYFYKDGREIDLFDMPASRVLRGEKVTNFYFIRKDLKGETYFLFNGSPIYDKDGNIIYGIFFNLDITEQVLHKKLIPVTEQLAALNALKDKLFTIFMHDIRTPMYTMVNLIELLEDDEVNYSSDSREIIAAVKEQVNHTNNIVEKLLEWLISQKEGLVYNPLIWELSNIIQEVINMYYISASAKDIRISSDIATGMGVLADKAMLESVLCNILSNAVKFTHNGGLITITAYIAGNKTVIAIKDTGKGIESEKIKTLFCENYVSSTSGTAGEKGIGLGLLICKEFVTKNGGELWVDSTSEMGSTFCFSLLTADI